MFLPQLWEGIEYNFNVPIYNTMAALNYKCPKNAMDVDLPSLQLERDSCAVRSVDLHTIAAENASRKTGRSIKFYVLP